MPLIYQQLMEQIAASRKEFGLSMQPPCNSKDLADLQVRARNELGAEIPPGYVQFLGQHNGLSWNGLVIFASKTVPIVGCADKYIEGLVDWNLDFRSAEWKNRFLVFGESDLDLYIYEPRKKKFSACDRISLDEAESYASFEEMITEALRKHL
ncbi:YrhA family protein [Archangium sp.]|uniref:YrhA family protein n=1 Tax=Archangium sp. TaxID=1872627 RepID=UPI00286AAC64|nr:YrhA family protein [Archangium sp.]